MESKWEFPYEPGSGTAAGRIAQSPMQKPSEDGTMVYQNANPDMQPVLDKVETAGEKIVILKTQITPKISFMAFI